MMPLIEIIVLSGFVLALIAPFIVQACKKYCGWIFAIHPLVLSLWFGSRLANSNHTLYSVRPIIPELNINFSFYLDQFALLFGVIVCGIGTLIMIYAGGYLKNYRKLGRFYLILIAFMASMLGLVLSDNAMTLFIFWELTSVTSYLLIGFHHHQESSRKKALQAFLVTGGGGLAMFAGLLMLGSATGTLEFSKMIELGIDIRSHSLYLPIVLLIVAGCFTKSAQFPFHFWLPNAMDAPTPVSAYLHSATMVKAGVFFLARLNPILGGTELWQSLLTIGGGATIIVGGYLAFQHTDLKKLLAYSTVGSLGVLTLLIGIGTEAAILGFITFLLAHAMYKGALFMVAGIVDHATGTRDVTILGGLRKTMPITFWSAVLAALSMIGLIPFFGFIGKEYLMDAASSTQDPLLAAVAVLAGASFTGVALIVLCRSFLGKEGSTPKQPHEVSVDMWLGPAILGVAGLASGITVAMLGNLILGAGSNIGTLSQEQHLALFHGLNTPLILSLIAIAIGLAIYLAWNKIQPALQGIAKRIPLGPEALYDLDLKLLERLSAFHTSVIQNGFLRHYFAIFFATATILAGAALLSDNGLMFDIKITEYRFYEIAILGLAVIGSFFVLSARSRLGAVALLGVVGFAIAMTYILFGAPDLAMTQLLIETLTVILFVLIFYHLPKFSRFSSSIARVRDFLVAVSFGGLMTVLVLVVTHLSHTPSISKHFAETSVEQAHGRNIVNTILVDYRGFDTLGEITVLCLAALGVYALLRLKPYSSEEECNL